MKYGKDGLDFSKKVWEAGLIGIWFGSWDIQDLYDAYEAYPPKLNSEVSNSQIAEYVNRQLRGRQLPANMKAEFVPSIKTFDEKLSKGSWVCSYFDGNLHLGQIADEAPHDAPHFNWNNEHFKARRVKNRKPFDIAKLPDAFRLISSAGRQTLHRLTSHQRLISILITSKNVNEALEQVRALPLREWIDILGDKGWESVCTAYLILEHGFLPTGLLVGSTLADFDIVGHGLDKFAIYAQCKKTPTPYTFSKTDKQSFARLPKDAKKFFFPYAGGTNESSMPEVSVISYTQLSDWLESTENGKRYRDILRLGG